MDITGGGLPRELIPPRSFEVRGFAAARACEVEALYSALTSNVESTNSASLSVTTPRHLRRRTSSHNRKRRSQGRPRGSAGNEKENQISTQAIPDEERGNVISGLEPGGARKRKADGIRSRRGRRKEELQEVKAGNGSLMGDGTRRLTTHVWHAKRFPMTKQWGYMLPKGLPGRGKGSRSVFKLVNEEAVIHDASYIGIIELRGPKDGIMKVLDKTFEELSTPGSELPIKENEVQGSCYGTAMLRSRGKSPVQTIAPVAFLWRPYCSGSKASPGLSKVGEVEERQLWVWVHPDVFECALDTFTTACRDLGSKTCQPFVKCYSRRDELARLDLFGRNALNVLQKVLRPSLRKDVDGTNGLVNPIGKDMDRNASTQESAQSELHATLLKEADRLPMAAVLALDVHDPRDKPIASSQKEKSSGETGDSDKQLVLDGQSPVEAKSSREEELAPLEMEEDDCEPSWKDLVKKGLAREVSDSPNLWSPANDDLGGALSQRAMSEKRHKIRNALFGLARSGSEFTDLDRFEGQSRLCPILLLKNTHVRPSASGWSIILPSTWVHAFWVPLVLAGGRAIGLRERHWLSTDAGIPYFPNDFPDCAAHARHLKVEGDAFNAANARRPPLKKAPTFSVSPLQRLAMNVHGYCFAGCIRNTASSIGPRADESMTQIDSAAKALNLQALEKTCTSQCLDPLVETTYDDKPQHLEEQWAISTPIEVDSKAINDAARLDGGTASATAATQILNPGSECFEQDAEVVSATKQTKMQVEDILSASVASPTFGGAGHQTPADLRPDPVETESTGVDRDPMDIEGSYEAMQTETASQPANVVEQNASARIESPAGREMILSSAPQSHVGLSNVHMKDHNAVDRNMPPALGDFVSTAFSESEDLKSKESEQKSRTSTDYLASPRSAKVPLQDGLAVQENEDSFGDGRKMASDSSQCAHTSLPFLIARTPRALMHVLNGNDEQNDFVQRSCESMVEDGGRLKRARLDGYTSHFISESTKFNTEIYTMMGESTISCYVRVLIGIPRKGVVKENGVLCLPTDEDINAYLDRAQRWQGVEISVPRRQSRTSGKKKRNKQNNDGPQSGRSDVQDCAQIRTDDERYEENCKRKIIGCITSTGPRGSLWSGTGICEVGSLMKMRAIQWNDERWRDRCETLLLAGSQRSPILRPVLVSIAVESGYKLDI